MGAGHDRDGVLPRGARRQDDARHVTLAATEEPIGTWLGSTAGMVAGDAIAIAIGSLMGTRLPERAIALFAAGAFVVFGALLIAEGLGVV